MNYQFSMFIVVLVGIISVALIIDRQLYYDKQAAIFPTIPNVEYTQESRQVKDVPNLSTIIQSKYDILEKEVQAGRSDPMSGFDYNLEITNDDELKYWLETMDAYEKIDSIDIEIIELIKSNHSFVVVLINGTGYDFYLGQQNVVDDVSITLITLQDKLIVFRLEYAGRFRDKVFIKDNL